MLRNIHPLWFVCLIVRIIYTKILIDSLKLNNINYNILPTILGFGFLYKYFTGSNNEIQISKVFWHDSRLVHGILYLLISYFYYKKNIKNTLLILILDIIFSLLYRILN